MSDDYDGKVNGEVVLNLADWIDRRRDAVGPYADHIIHSVRAHEAEISRLRAELATERELGDRLASSVEWFLSETETNRGDDPMDDRGGLSWNQINEYWIRYEDIAADILASHAARRTRDE